jgi:hypothetical protein
VVIEILGFQASAGLYFSIAPELQGRQGGCGVPLTGRALRVGLSPRCGAGQYGRCRGLEMWGEALSAFYVFISA